MSYNLIPKSFLGLALLAGISESSSGNIPLKDRKPRLQYSYRYESAYNLPLEIVIPTEIFQADLMKFSKRISEK
jgi:hypothetical protein